MIFLLYISPIFFLINQVICKIEANVNSTYKLAPCQVCRALVGSFDLGIEKTGKANWKEVNKTAQDQRIDENKIEYNNSERRFNDIQQDLCHDLKNGKDQCHELAIQVEPNLKEWWMKRREIGPLHSWLCIDQLAVCCPEKHFGPKCLPCIGFPGPVCSGHGICKGAGTRKGNGDCNCDTGYTGKLCQECSEGYYEAFKDEEKIICSACHKSCQGGCSGAGPKACKSCKEGWDNDEEVGCLDFNECLMVKNPCNFGEFCVNTEGSYSCIECDKACDGCIGDGPDSCEKCASGFQLVDQFCVDGSTMGGLQGMNATRYLTYFGLCIATCIIFQKNVLLASLVGMAVALYISASEYMIRTSVQEFQIKPH